MSGEVPRKLRRCLDRAGGQDFVVGRNRWTGLFHAIRHTEEKTKVPAFG